MPHRIITGLQWARPCPRPKCIPKGRARGAKAAGLRFEKLVAQAIPDALHGPWFEFCDANGPGYCQPDIIMVGKTHVLCIECKLTDTETAWKQLNELYLPILSHVYNTHAFGIVVVRHLTRTTRRDTIYTTLPDAIRAGTGTVHWLGYTPLMG